MGEIPFRGNTMGVAVPTVFANMGFMDMPRNSDAVTPRRGAWSEAIARSHTHTTTSIPQHLSEPVYRQARHIFLRDTVVLTPRSNAVSRGHFANLTGLLEASPDSDALCAATDAVASTLLVTRFGMSGVRPLAVARYSTAISSMRAQMTASNTEYRMPRCKYIVTQSL